MEWSATGVRFLKGELGGYTHLFPLGGELVSTIVLKIEKSVTLRQYCSVRAISFTNSFVCASRVSWNGRAIVCDP
jgi:hypothetical protein